MITSPVAPTFADLLADVLDKAVIVKLSEAEHKTLNIRAAQAGMTQQAYARMLLVMQSLMP